MPVIYHQVQQRSFVYTVSNGTKTNEEIFSSFQATCACLDWHTKPTLTSFIVIRFIGMI